MASPALCQLYRHSFVRCRYATAEPGAAAAAATVIQNVGQSRRDIACSASYWCAFISPLKDAACAPVCCEGTTTEAFVHRPSTVYDTWRAALIHAHSADCMAGYIASFLSAPKILKYIAVYRRVCDLYKSTYTYEILVIYCEVKRWSRMRSKFDFVKEIFNSEWHYYYKVHVLILWGGVKFGSLLVCAMKIWKFVYHDLS